MAANNLAAEPDEERGEVERHDSTSPTPSRPKSTAIWKSILSATGGFGCERQTYYHETIRDARGYRLDFGADEPVVFGIALDRVHRQLFEAYVRGDDLPLEDAVNLGVGAARGRSLSAVWEPDDWLILRGRLALAAEKLVGLWPNRVTEKGVELPEPDGTPEGPPIRWLLPPPGVTVDAQVKLFANNAVGERALSGQPDYAYRAEGRFVGWADIKALSKSGSYPAKWTAGEAVAYDYLLTANNNGVPPEWHTYMEYRRVMKPYWAVISAPVESASITLARSYFARWRVALDADDPDGLSFNPRACARCHFREAIPALGYDGCPIGQDVLAVAPALPVDDE